VSIQYLIDENLPLHWRKQLLRHAPALVVMRIGDPGAPPLHSTDPALIDWCEENEFVLVTNNRRSMPRHLADHMAAGRHVPGIFVIDPSMTVGRLFDELILIAGASLENEYQDQIRHLPFT
jgi:hypothetical protein